MSDVQGLSSKKHGHMLEQGRSSTPEAAETMSSCVTIIHRYVHASCEQESKARHNANVFTRVL